MIIALWILGVLGVLFGLYLLSAPIIAFIEYKSAPRVPMEWCHKHGYFRREYCLPMAGTLVCPQCYLSAISDAGKVALLK